MDSDSGDEEIIDKGDGRHAESYSKDEVMTGRPEYWTTRIRTN